MLAFWLPWDEPDRKAREPDLRALRDSIDEVGDELRAHLVEGTDLVIRDVAYGGFEVAAVFSDLVAGVLAARALARAHGVAVRLSLSEAWSSSPDPLEHLRAAWAEEEHP